MQTLDLAAVHARLDAIGNEHQEPMETQELGSGATAVAEALGIDPAELKADARERIKPALALIGAAGGLRLDELAGVLIGAYIDGVLTGAGWGRLNLDA